MNLKRCPTCKIEKAAIPDNFGRHVSRKDGLHWQCKLCRVESDKRHRLKAKEKGLANRKKKYDSKKFSARNSARAKWGAASQWKCSVLTCASPGEALHHIDYGRPLDVIPLCRFHHEIEHHK